MAKLGVAGGALLLCVFFFVLIYNIFSFFKLNSRLDDLSLQISDTNTSLVGLYNNRLASETIDKMMESMTLVVSVPLTKETGSSQDSIFVDDKNNPIGNKGAGFFISCDGYLLTAAHVIQDAQVTYVYYENKLVPAEIINSNADSDIAVLKIEADTTPAKEGNYDILRRGSRVSFIGLPQGGASDSQGITITKEGTISFFGLLPRSGPRKPVATITINAFVNHG